MRGLDQRHEVGSDHRAEDIEAMDVPDASCVVPRARDGLQRHGLSAAGGETVAPRVIEAVSRHAGVPVGDLVGRSRVGRVAEVRQPAMWIVRGVAGLSYRRIGECFDRHHTSVLHACAVTEGRLRWYRHLRVLRDAVLEELDAGSVATSEFRGETSTAGDRGAGSGRGVRS